MSTALQLLQVALPTLYMLAAALHGAAVAGHAARSSQLRQFVLTATLVAHAAWFVLLGLQQGQSPITGLWPTVSAVVFSAVVFWILVAREERHVGSGGVVLSVAAVFQLLASGFGPIEPEARAAQSTLALVHVLTSVVAAAGLTVSGLHGALWLLMYRELRLHRFGAVFGHLPDLETCARMMRRAALFGFLGLTIGLNVGIALAHQKGDFRVDYGNPEVLGSLLVWLYFGAIAFSARIPGFGSRRAAIAACAGLVALALSLLLVFSPIPFHRSL